MNGTPIEVAAPQLPRRRTRAQVCRHVPDIIDRRRTNFLGLALLVTSLFSDVCPIQPTMAMSKDITTTWRPSVLHQLASFLALEENAEEEGVDTFIPHHDPNAAATKLAKSLIDQAVAAREPTTDEEAPAPKVTLLAALKKKSLSLLPTSMSRKSAPATERRCSSPSSSSASTSDTAALSSSAATTSSKSSKVKPSTASSLRPSTDVPVRWEQLDVLDLAKETGSVPFFHRTEGMLARGLYPTIFRVFVDEIVSPSERRLTSANSRGKGNAKWACVECHKKHDDIREACIKCGAPNGDVVKMFVGQLRKEARCDDAVVRLLHATAPDVPVLRVEGHTIDNGQRGKGCASVYTTRIGAERLAPLLNRNVFMDFDWNTGREVFYFAYEAQQDWMRQFAEVRVGVAAQHRPSTLPRQVLVAEFAQESRKQHRQQFLVPYSDCFYNSLSADAPATFSRVIWANSQLTTNENFLQ